MTWQQHCIEGPSSYGKQKFFILCSFSDLFMAISGFKIFYLSFVLLQFPFFALDLILNQLCLLLLFLYSFCAMLFPAVSYLETSLGFASLTQELIASPP